MPRESRTRINPLPTPELVSKPVAQKVVARPVDPYVPMPPDYEFNQLMAGLSTFNSKLGEYIEVREAKELERGARSRQSGETLPEDPSSAFQHGYMVMDGRVKGIEDGTAIRAAYEAEFDKDSGDVESFLSDQWSGKTAGLTDEAFLKGYRQIVGPYMDEIRKAQGEFQKRRIVETADANALNFLDHTIRSYADRGNAIPTEHLELFKQDMKEFFNVDGKRFNEMLFLAVKRLGDEGNFSIYETLKRPHKDGTPGMYFIPAWKEKIDAAQIHAQSVFLAKQNQATEAARKLREERQDMALMDVALAYHNGDTDGGRSLFNKHVREGLFTHAGDYLKWTGAFSKAENRELRADEEVVMTEMLAGIYTGNVGIRDILQSDLPSKAQRQLLSEWRAKLSGDRQAAATGATTEELPFRSHKFREEETWIEGQLASIQDMLGQFTNKNDFIRGARASAKLELAEHVRKNGLEGVREKTIEIVERHKDRIRMFDENQLDLAGKSLRYRTPAETRLNADKLSDADLALHLLYFQNRKKQPKGKSSNAKR